MIFYRVSVYYNIGSIGVPQFVFIRHTMTISRRRIKVCPSTHSTYLPNVRETEIHLLIKIALGCARAMVTSGLKSSDLSGIAQKHWTVFGVHVASDQVLSLATTMQQRLSGSATVISLINFLFILYSWNTTCLFSLEQSATSMSLWGCDSFTILSVYLHIF